MKEPMTWRRFGLSMLDSAINGACNAMLVIGADPTDFNFGAGNGKLLTIAVGNFVFGAVVFLKNHRLPGTEGE